MQVIPKVQLSELKVPDFKRTQNPNKWIDAWRNYILDKFESSGATII